jgi:aquaporin Z
MNESEKITLPTPVTPAKKYFAELIGTMVLVLMGCGSAVIAGNVIGFSGISFAFGLSVVAMAYTIGTISGCHINPAISISMLVAGKLSVKDTAFYVVFQCIGAIIGAGILYGIAVGGPSFNAANLGQNGYDLASPGGYTLASALIAEIVLTFIFVLVVHGSTVKKHPKDSQAVIGLTLVKIHLVNANRWSIRTQQEV